MSDRNWPFVLRGVAILVLTLVAGVAAGFAMDRAFLRPDAPSRDSRDGDRSWERGGDHADRGGRGRYESMLYDQLDLTPAQRAQIDSAIEHGRRQTDAYWARVEPEMRSIVDSTRARIRAVLTPEQLARYDSLRAERRKVREKEWERERERQREWERGHGRRDPR